MFQINNTEKSIAILISKGLAISNMIFSPLLLIVTNIILPLDANLHYYKTKHNGLLPTFETSSIHKKVHLLKGEPVFYCKKLSTEVTDDSP